MSKVRGGSRVSRDCVGRIDSPATEYKVVENHMRSEQVSAYARTDERSWELLGRPDGLQDRKGGLVEGPELRWSRGGWPLPGPALLSNESLTSPRCRGNEVMSGSRRIATPERARPTG